MVDVLNVRSTAANPKLFFLPNRATALRSQLTGRMTLHLNSEFNSESFSTVFFVKSIHFGVRDCCRTLEDDAILIFRPHCSQWSYLLMSLEQEFQNSAPWANFGLHLPKFIIF